MTAVWDQRQRGDCDEGVFAMSVYTRIGSVAAPSRTTRMVTPSSPNDEDEYDHPRGGKPEPDLRQNDAPHGAEPPRAADGGGFLVRHRHVSDASG